MQQSQGRISTSRTVWGALLGTHGGARLGGSREGGAEPRSEVCAHESQRRRFLLDRRILRALRSAPDGARHYCSPKSEDGAPTSERSSAPPSLRASALPLPPPPANRNCRSSDLPASLCGVSSRCRTGAAASDSDALWCFQTGSDTPLAKFRSESRLLLFHRALGDLTCAPRQMKRSGNRYSNAVLMSPLGQLALHPCCSCLDP